MQGYDWLTGESSAARALRCWKATRPPETDPDLREAMQHRGVDARSIMSAGCGILFEQRRAIIPIFDADCTAFAVKSRSVMLDKRSSRTLGAVGGGVMASTSAMMLLLYDIAPKLVVIVEGETDLWTWESLVDDRRSHDGSVAIFGTGQGLWSEQLASRIPDGTPVYLRTDCDAQGDAYAQEIGRTLAHRCELWRVDADSRCDDSERHQLGVLGDDPRRGCSRFFCDWSRPAVDDGDHDEAEISDRKRARYFLRVLERSCERCRAAAPGQRSAEVSAAAYVVGQYLEACGASRKAAFSELLQAAPVSRTFSRHEAESCIRRGLTAGERNGKTIQK